MSKNVICWFEIYVEDMERAKKFYGEVLNTSFEDADMPGDADNSMSKMAFFDTEGDMDAVSGALVYMDGARQGHNGAMSTMVYFPCADCRVEESRVEKSGGKVVTPKMAIGEHGFCSICLDSEGNSFGLHSLK